MKILLVNSAYDPALADFAGLIESYFTLSGWAEGLCRAGAKVSVLQRFKYPGVIDCNKVLYHFTSDGLAPGLRWWQLPVGFLSRATHWAVQARREDPEVVIHFNGLLFPLQTWWLRRVLPRDCAVVGQHHAEPPMPAWRGGIQRLGLVGVDRFLFNSCEQAKPWVQQGIICSLDLVDAVPEGSSPLTWRERAAARQATGMTGNPVLFWAGHLNQNKDPLTVLRGFHQILLHLPGARLYMAYRDDRLLPQVLGFLDTRPDLNLAVKLLGEIPLSKRSDYFNSADYFVQGSHHEGSGFALLDALACGVIPVVTDIPAFRALTDQGKLGKLWSVEDDRSFSQAFLALHGDDLAARSQKIQGYFQEQLSFSALSQRAMAVYGRTLDVRLRRTG